MVSFLVPPYDLAVLDISARSFDGLPRSIGHGPLLPIRICVTSMEQCGHRAPPNVLVNHLLTFHPPLSAKSKSIIYGTKNHMTQNFAVNLAWIFFGSIALLLVCARQRKKEDKEAIEKKAKEVREKEEKQNGRELTRDSSETLGNDAQAQSA